MFRLARKLSAFGLLVFLAVYLPRSEGAGPRETETTVPIRIDRTAHDPVEVARASCLSAMAVRRLRRPSQGTWMCSSPATNRPST